VLWGITPGNFTAAHQLRAALEGVTLGLNYGLRRLAALGVRPREIRLTGGGARSGVWRQVAADVFGVPVVKMAENEGAALGGALQAAWCDRREQGRPANLDSLCAATVRLDPKTRCEPDAANHRRYRKLQERQDELSRTLRPFLTAGPR